MTIPMNTDYLYGVHYTPEQISCEMCQSKQIYALTSTKHWMCLECGHQFPEDA